MSPHLTPEQKEHLKIAHRANMRIEETWSLFCMYLSQDKRPIEALELARNAVSVWADWMDVNEVEPPEIERPSFTEEMTSAMGKMFEHLKKNPGGIGGLVLDQRGGQAGFQPIANDADVDAEFEPGSYPPIPQEFVPAVQHGPDPTSAALANPEDLNRQDPPKND